MYSNSRRRSYAAPEMLLVQKYLGPKVDIWSLGIILYTLLTGTLPFDDDDDFIMREKIIVGQFETPDWLSPEVRDLIQNVLQHEPAKRLTIPRILAHPWFRPPAIASPTPLTPSTPDAATIIVTNVSQTQSLPSPCASEASFQTASSELPKSAVEQKEENERTIRGVPKQEDDKKGSSEGCRAIPAYFARIACLRVRLSVNVSSMGFGSLSTINSSSLSVSTDD